MRSVLVVANETLGGRQLLEAVKSRAEEEATRFVLCVPQNRPRQGLVIYDDAVYEAAQARVDLAVSFVRELGLEVLGEVGDPDPYTATMDAIREYEPDEVIISTHPDTRSGWQRRGLVDRVRDASGLPVEHVVTDLDTEGLPFAVTMVVANRTAASDRLLEHLKQKAAGHERDRLFVVVVPQEGGSGEDLHRARTRLALVLNRLRGAGLLASGMIGDPDPFVATMNALQWFRVDDITISTHPATRSGWLRANLVERVRKASSKPVDHVPADEPAPAGATS